MVCFIQDEAAAHTTLQSHTVCQCTGVTATVCRSHCSDFVSLTKANCLTPAKNNKHIHTTNSTHLPNQAKCVHACVYVCLGLHWHHAVDRAGITPTPLCIPNPAANHHRQQAIFVARQRKLKHNHIHPTGGLTGGNVIWGLNMQKGRSRGLTTDAVDHEGVQLLLAVLALARQVGHSLYLTVEQVV